jgi:hypothetical protein
MLLSGMNPQLEAEEVQAMVMAMDLVPRLEAVTLMSAAKVVESQAVEESES